MEITLIFYTLAEMQTFIIKFKAFTVPSLPKIETNFTLSRVLGIPIASNQGQKDTAGVNRWPVSQQMKGFWTKYLYSCTANITDHVVVQLSKNLEHKCLYHTSKTHWESQSLLSLTRNQLQYPNGNCAHCSTQCLMPYVLQITITLSTWLKAPL